MTIKEFKDYKYDLSLEEDATSRFLVWIIACLFFVAGLAMIGALSSKQMIKDWQSYASNQITIELPYVENDARDTDQLIGALTDLSAIRNVDMIPADETRNLIKPILGIEADTLPLPTLINATLRDGSNATLQDVKEVLDNSGIDGITIETHGTWANEILKFGRSLYLGGLTLFILMLSITGLTLIWAMVSRVKVHRDEIEVLTIIGADDHYITKQLQSFALFRTLMGCAIGFAMALVCVVIIKAFMGSSAESLIPISTIEAAAWLIAPLILCLVIAMTTARAAIMRTLSNLS